MSDNQADSLFVIIMMIVVLLFFYKLITYRKPRTKRDKKVLPPSNWRN